MKSSNWPPRPLPRPRLAVLALMVLVVFPLAGCSSRPAGTNPVRPAPSSHVLNPSDMGGAALEPPAVLVNYDGKPRPPQGTVQVAVRKNYSHSVQLRWERHLDLALAKQQLSVTPVTVLDHVDWEQGTSTAGKDWAQASLIFREPAPGSTVDVRLAAGVRGEDGSVLSKDVAFQVTFVEVTQVEIRLSGPSYLPGKTIVAASTDSGFPAIFRPGEAQLDIAFSQPVDRQRTWDLLTAQLAREAPDGQAHTVGEPMWTGDNRHLSVRIQQPTPLGDATGPSTQPALDFGVLLDARGLPVEPDHASLRWFVVRSLRTYRSSGVAVEAEPAGMIASLPVLRPAGPQSLRHDLLLTTYITGHDDDCYNFAPLVWDLATGNAVPLGQPRLACNLAEAQWWPDGRNILLVRDGEVLQFPLDPAKAFTDGRPPEPQRLYAPPEGRFLVGAALAPDGRLALLEARPGADNRGKIDLLLLSPKGTVLQRIKDVSDLIASEGFWWTIEAAWSPDGSTLAFLPYRQGDWRGEAHLTLWRDGTFSQPGPTAMAVSWRPGTQQILMRDSDGWRLFDASAGKVVEDDLPLPQSGWDVLWSPDGRFVALPGDAEATVLELETRKTRKGAFLPLGWGENGELYWAPID